MKIQVITRPLADLDVEVAPGIVRARVQGSRPHPYRIEMTVEPFADTVWDRVVGALALAGVLTILPETNRHRDPTATRPRRLAANYAGLLRNRTYLGYVVTVGAGYGGIFAFISGSAFALMVPVLAGFIAFSIADRPGLTPGLIGGMLAVSTGAGFLGGIIAGFLAGYVARAISSKLRLPQSMEALKPILIIPLVASLITGLIMIYVVGTPVAKIMEGLTHWLQSLGTANAVLLGAILGGMMCTDMGGPVNKAAYAFGVALLSSSVYAPMAAIMAAGMVPPLAMGLATLLARRKFPKSEQEGGKAALVLGLCFITEGAIPFAARDPMRVLPCCIAGGALTGALSMAFGAKLMAPHGGLFVLLIPGAISPVLLYLVAIAAGTLLAGVSYALLKRAEVPAASVA